MQLGRVLQNSSCIVGMHPDEVTDAIVETALHLGKAFAVVPCCVFASSWPDRLHPSTGEPVRLLGQFLDYLQAKAPHVRRHVLRTLKGPTNIVIYAHALPTEMPARVCSSEE